MGKVKLLTFYLPQYHEIPENNEFWGEGFTDWVTVKKAKSLFNGHIQPKVPQNNNYYDLSEISNIKWQSDLAQKYGIDGWGIYHYWFSDEKVLLTKPAELILDHSEINIPFFFAWDNANWKRSWSNLKGNAWSPIMDVKEDKGQPPLLIEYKLGEEKQWKTHFEYLLPYFKDARYIIHNNKPLLIILNYSEQVKKMSIYWDELAREHGFAGVEVVYKYDHYKVPREVQTYTYEPAFSGWGQLYQRVGQKIRTKLKIQGLRKYSYDRTWRRIINNAKRNSKQNNYYGAFVSYDDTPRRGNNGKVFVGNTAQSFELYLQELVDISMAQGKDFIFLNAWNEWGEGAYLEPDEINRNSYLEAVSNVRK